MGSKPFLLKSPTSDGRSIATASRISFSLAAPIAWPDFATRSTNAGAIIRSGFPYGGFMLDVMTVRSRGNPRRESVSRAADGRPMTSAVYRSRIRASLALLPAR